MLVDAQIASISLLIDSNFSEFCNWVKAAFFSWKFYVWTENSFNRFNAEQYVARWVRAVDLAVLDDCCILR